MGQTKMLNDSQLAKGHSYRQSTPHVLTARRITLADQHRFRRFTHLTFAPARL